MIQFEFGKLWWLIGIPIFLAFILVVEQINKHCVIPSFYEAQEILREIKSNRKQIFLSTIMLITVLIYLFLFFYCVAFIVQLTLEAELSFAGLFIFFVYIFFSVFIKKVLTRKNKGK